VKTIKIYGGSDDLIEVEGECKGCDEYNTGTYNMGPHMGTISLNAGDNSVRIHCIYDGSWAFAVCPQDGDFDFMPWDLRREFGANSPYSETVEIDVPDDCEVSFV
jgi:hypothetical protein